MSFRSRFRKLDNYLKEVLNLNPITLSSSPLSTAVGESNASMPTRLPWSKEFDNQKFILPLIHLSARPDAVLRLYINDDALAYTINGFVTAAIVMNIYLAFKPFDGGLLIKLDRMGHPVNN